jgi:hypothetical protein
MRSLTGNDHCARSLIHHHAPPSHHTHTQALAPTLPNVVCYKVDVDDAEELAAMNNVESMPTFKMFRGGAEVATTTGSDFAKLQSLVSVVCVPRSVALDLFSTPWTPSSGFPEPVKDRPTRLTPTPLAWSGPNVPPTCRRY